MRTQKKTEQLLQKDPKIPSDSAVALTAVSFGYEREKPILRSVSLDIRKGQSIAFIGPNGSGKSTLAKIIDGILVQDGGEIYIFGVRMTDNNALLLRKDIGLVFQNPDSQFIGATVRDDIAFGLENACVPSNEMAARIQHVATEVGMEDYLDVEPANLSGGQKQRVAIAGAIVRNPKILILDEAGAMLDPSGKREIRQIIRNQKKENPDMTLITITHEIDETYDSDRIIVLNKGAVVLDGTPQDVFSHDDLLKSIQLDIPFAHRLANALKKRGLDIGDVKNDEDLLTKLCP
jgi:energy-coupling factor transport system ATP-binding protein